MMGVVDSPLPPTQVNKTSMNITETFVSILEQEMNGKPPKKTSLIREWLGTDEVPQSVSIRMGNYLEIFFTTIMGVYNSLGMLNLNGRQYTITVDNEVHQVDLLSLVNGVLVTRELKCNLDLDRGKTRDTLRREEEIERGLKEQFKLKVDGGIFCPFFYGKVKKDGKFGSVYGLQWFIETFECDFTVEDFIQMGRSKEVHSTLFG